jgi:hypothetical protein
LRNGQFQILSKNGVDIQYHCVQVEKIKDKWKELEQIRGIVAAGACPQPPSATVASV